ncbi:hypothetical protein QUH46_26605, partial [Klebsiella grimontii]|uniref:hypothetical protein n=1 Tax=Klebsiella grimontii TaxID=2058152 RepID=UPI0025A1BDF3
SFTIIITLKLRKSLITGQEKNKHNINFSILNEPGNAGDGKIRNVCYGVRKRMKCALPRHHRWRGARSQKHPA